MEKERRDSERGTLTDEEIRTTFAGRPVGVTDADSGDTDTDTTDADADDMDADADTDDPS